ncbi:MULTISPECIES: hypothetical protein [Actinomadura]|uniref:Uncharacterized protein n=1 Tax=Actinomadura yumaensis TaxID=111807 RepID=A0ABW2CFP0_9ACTN|nr:hypothetical protein [Actinomadura sp. J1-007]MWK35827.1 hypothetical protein [Actinomadura sp. J1-007]
MSLAGAYAYGYLALALAQQDDEERGWLNDTDPLDVILLGAVFPAKFRGAGEFSNALTAWLEVLRGTHHWASIQRFIAEAVAVSRELGLPVDDPTVLLRLAARIEKAGLDQPRLPAALLPNRALADARFGHGPPPDLELPTPSAKAQREAHRLLSEFDLGPTYENTCAEELATGLSLFINAGLPVCDESSLLLMALYSALAASDDEDLDLLGEQSTDWALGLREDSPLLPVADILLSATPLNLDPLTTVSHLFMLPAFTQSVRSEDRDWHGGPGTLFIKVAFELGHSHVETRRREVFRLGPLAAAEMRSFQRKREEHLGRPPAPDDLLFADNGPLDLAAADRARTALLESAGIHPAWIYASSQNDGLLPRSSGDFLRPRDREDWEKSIDEYIRQHPDEEIDHELEAWKLRSMLGMMTVRTATEDHEYGIQVTALLDSTSPSGEDSLQTIYDFLGRIGPALADAIEEEPHLAVHSATLAADWSGPCLARRVLDSAKNLPTGDSIDDPAATFILAVAFLHGQKQ